MPKAHRQIQPPYTLDRAVSDEVEFWRHIGELIDSAVGQALDRALEKHGFKNAVDSMKIVANSQKVVIQRLNKLDERHGQVAVDVSRLAGWATEKGLQDEVLERKITRLLEILTPPMPESPAPPPPTPPNEPPPARPPEED